MNAEAATTWGHGRHLTGRVHRMSIMVGGHRRQVVTPQLLSVGGLTDDEHDRGADRAVTVHPHEHYTAWADAGLPPVGTPAFGEQLTTTGLLETEVFVGDTFRWGGAEVQVSAPAVPDEAVGAPGVADRLRRSGRTGFHLRVVRSGRVGADDALVLVDVDPAGVSLATVSVALIDGPAAAGVSPQRLLMLRGVLPPDLVQRWERLLPAADQHGSADRVPTAG